MKTIFASSLPLLTLLAMVPAMPGAPLSRQALQKQDIALLQRVEDTANDVLTTSERLDSYNHVPTEYCRELHMYQLDTLKDQINAMTRDLDRVATSRGGLDAADRKAVEKVLILAMELAQSANAAIVQAGRIEVTPSLSAEYRKLMSDCYRQAGELVKALGAGIVELR